MSTFSLRSIALLVTAVLASGAGADRGRSCHADSEVRTQPLIELYTSEGCSSCPPADRWLARNFSAPGATAHAVALAFHVDYWDRLGWIDRFGSARYTERQYTAMQANGASFVYTPQVLLQGRDFPGWRHAGTDAIDALARKSARATLTLEAKPVGTALSVAATAQIADPALRGEARLFIAYADSGLVSDITAGETRGVRLLHEHVVRTLLEAGEPDAQGRIDASVNVERPREPGVRPMLVAFVQRRSTGDVLQTVALPLDGCADR